MTSKLKWALGAAGLVGLGGAWTLLSSKEVEIGGNAETLPKAASAPTPNRGQEDSSSAAIRREMSNLRGQLAQLRNELQLDREKGQEADPASRQKAAEQARSYAEGEAAERAHTQKLIGFLDDHLRHEPNDPAWSPVARAEIEQRFGPGKDAASQVGETFCQSSMCRVDATHSSGDAEQSFLMGLSAMPSFHDSEAFTERYEQSDGSVKTRTFITRSGDHLPDPGELSLR